MPGSQQNFSTDPMLPSTLLSLDLRSPVFDGELPGSQLDGLHVDGMDPRFRQLWRGGSVVGLGSEEKDSYELSLALNVVASALLRKPGSSPMQHKVASAESDTLSSSPTTVFIVAPHTCQTIPLLHTLLAKRMSNSVAAVDLLKKVQLLQYFDLAGLVESIAEVNESIYQFPQVDSLRDQTTPKTINTHQEPEHVVLIEGLASTLSATQRRSGLVQANALLASLTRSIAQLSKLARRPLVLISIPIDVRTRRETGETETTYLQRAGQGLQLESAFSGPNGESYTLACGSMLLSQTLAESLDRLVHVHDAFGKAPSRRRDPNLPAQYVIEVMKDRVGNLTGLWAIWQGHST